MNNKTSIRPEITTIKSTENQSIEEQFQNVTLRPIIKLQHDLLVAFFENHIQHSKLNWDNFDSLKKAETVNTIFQNDNRLKTEVRGLIIGLFTVEEYATYSTISSDANKRIITIIKERILSVI
jgi:hypothetical protein